MLPSPKNYSIYPSVIPADKQVDMTIVPNEPTFLFFENESYCLKIVPVDSDVLDYSTLQTATVLSVTAHNGVLRFPFTFCGEQEHLIILEYNEKKLQELYVYSLYEDLYALRPLKGDLHVHSHRSDGKRDAAAQAGHFREQGYDFFALTDHNRYYPGDEIDDAYDGVDLAINHIAGEEIHTPPSLVHIVHVGGKESVASQYIKDTEGYESAIKRYIANVPDSVPEQYRDRYAMATWACDRIHAAGGLAIFPHPFWRTSSRAHNVTAEFARILLKSGMFDAYELVGGMQQSGVNSSVALWSDLRAEGFNINVVGSSDVHSLERSVDFPDHFTVCFAKSNTTEDILSAISQGYSVACEGTGYEYDRHYRAYGNYRLVTYSQFLFKHYFPLAQRICQGEGVAMRSYIMGISNANIIECQAEQSKLFCDRFFGKADPILPSSDIIDFENKWRKIHVEEGPITKGSRIYSDTVTRQI